MPTPDAVADVAEHLVRFRLTETEFGQLWGGAGEVQVAVNDFRRARLGLPPSPSSWLRNGASGQHDFPPCCG